MRGASSRARAVTAPRVSGPVSSPARHAANAPTNASNLTGPIWHSPDSIVPRPDGTPNGTPNSAS